MKLAIVAENIVKEFGGVKALDGLSLKIPEGITFGLLGPNGAGKTTLIRILVGILSPTSGKVEVLGKRPGTRESALEKGYMTQQSALYQDLTVEENLEFFAKMFGVGGKEKRRRRIDEILKLVDLVERRKALVSSLSGGMKQRTSLACALIHEPKVLFLDEPTVGVDPALRKVFWDHFKRLSDAGATVVISSHVMDEAERCDRLGLLRNGKLLIEGSLDDILEKTSAAKLEEAFLSLESGGLPVLEGGSVG